MKEWIRKLFKKEEPVTVKDEREERLEREWAALIRYDGRAHDENED